MGLAVRSGRLLGGGRFFLDFKKVEVWASAQRQVRGPDGPDGADRVASFWMKGVDFA